MGHLFINTLRGLNVNVFIVILGLAWLGLATWLFCLSILPLLFFFGGELRLVFVVYIEWFCLFVYLGM